MTQSAHLDTSLLPPIRRMSDPDSDYVFENTNEGERVQSNEANPWGHRDPLQTLNCPLPQPQPTLPDFPGVSASFPNAARDMARIRGATLPAATSELDRLLRADLALDYASAARRRVRDEDSSDPEQPPRRF